MAHIVLACISYGLYNYGLYSYDLCSYGLYSYGLYSYGLYSHGIYSFDLESMRQALGKACDQHRRQIVKRTGTDTGTVHSAGLLVFHQTCLFDYSQVGPRDRAALV